MDSMQVDRGVIKSLPRSTVLKGLDNDANHLLSYASYTHRVHTRMVKKGAELYSPTQEAWTMLQTTLVLTHRTHTGQHENVQKAS
jgi:hypothetical protein